jgi:hypothetical protein
MEEGVGLNLTLRKLADNIEVLELTRDVIKSVLDLFAPGQLAVCNLLN